MDFDSIAAHNHNRLDYKIKKMENNKPTIRRQSDDFITITDLWHICLAHWNWFVASLIICIALASLYLASTPDRYTHEMAVLVKQDTQGKNAGKTSGNGNNDFNDIGLVQQPVNVVNVQRQLVSLDVLTEVARRMLHPKDEREALRMAESMKSNLKAEIDDDKSTIINIKYSGFTPEITDKILATIVNVYNEKWIADKNKMTANTSHFIEERLRLLERDLGNVDDSISKFKTHNKITDLDRVSDMYLQQQSQSDAEILRLSSQRSMAHYILDILKDKGSRHQLLPTNSGINNQMAETQINQYNTMLLQLKSNLVGTSSQNPLIIKQEAELDDVRKNILSTIANQIKTLDIQLHAMQGYSGEASSKISSNPNQAKHLVSVEREQKVKESLYLYLLQKKEENEISMTYTAVNTQVIDMPHGSDEPSSPNKRLTLFAAMLLALLAPTVILFTRESLDNTVRDKQDIEHNTTLSLIGDIPLYIRKKNGIIGNISMKKSGINLVVEEGKQDIVNEAFRMLRTNIEFMTPHRGENNVYVITSIYEGSGKTFVATNLALTLALTGKRVLFIDGDLRHASASHQFRTSSAGLADYLGDKQNDLTMLIEQNDDQPSLYVMPVGTIPPNPTELLSGDRLGELIEKVRPSYDFIIIDCPPTGTLADTGLIERFADRTLFIIRAGLFERRRIEDIENYAQNERFKHVSLVLNATKGGGRYGYRYGYHYGYRYGYGKKKKGFFR